jgi:cyclic pyranopterin phosphate synthase
LRDRTGRNIDYLRISVTDRCNLRCAYCVPQEGPDVAQPYRLLSREEILRVVKTARALGVTHVRLTGGEPLTRQDLPAIASGVRELGIEDLSLTTNGTLLAGAAARLKGAGLSRVNVSLDSLRPEVFRKITRNGSVHEVLAGIRAAIRAGLSPVKVNAVVMAGVNDQDVEDLARLSLLLPVSVRFIEVMPIGPDPEANARAAFPMDQVRDRVSSLGPLSPAGNVAGAGPAQVFRLPGAPGTVGFIAPLSHRFCAGCNRLRLTPDGKLRPCLASDVEVDLVPALRGTDVEGDLAAAFRQALFMKPAGHELWTRHAHSRRMCQIGG